MATAHEFARAGHPIQLAARSVERLAAARADLEIRHQVAVSLHELDVLDSAAVPAFIAGLPALPGIAICAVGLLGSHQDSISDPDQAARVLRSNFEAPALLLGQLATLFEARGSGTLVGISSVAGERGRGSNYIYGSAKAGFTAYLSGLRNRLAKRGVHVITVLPGFVDTAMTEGMNTPAPLTAQPDEVARHILRAVARRRNVIYVRPVWRLIMGVIRAIPEAVFKRLSL